MTVREKRATAVGIIVAGGLLVGGLLCVLPTPADVARLSFPPAPAPHVLTCADLPAITSEMDGLEAGVVRYGWIILIGAVLGLMKLGEIIAAIFNGIEWLLRRAWTAVRSRRERIVL